MQLNDLSVILQEDDMGKKSTPERACLRCGCTELKACAGGCCWVAHSNVCSSCLTPAERQMHDYVKSKGSMALLTLFRNMLNKPYERKN